MVSNARRKVCDTLVADAAAAFDALPEERQAELEKLSIVHNRAHLIQKYSRSVLSPEEMARMQDVIHPIAVKSDVDGRKSLFITNGSTKRIEGMEEEESWALVTNSSNIATQPQFVCAHKWRVATA